MILDLLGEVPGGGTYDGLLPHSLEVQAFGHRFRVVDLPTLIHLKRAGGNADKERGSFGFLRAFQAVPAGP